MSRKREQRLRRKARAQVARLEREMAETRQALAAALARAALPVANVVAIKPVGRLPTLPAAPRSPLWVSELELIRRAFHAAAAKYGAEANKHERDRARMDELRGDLDAAARAFAVAEALVRGGARRLA